MDFAYLQKHFSKAMAIYRSPRILWSKCRIFATADWILSSLNTSLALLRYIHLSFAWIFRGNTVRNSVWGKFSYGFLFWEPVQLTFPGHGTFLFFPIWELFHFFPWKFEEYIQFFFYNFRVKLSIFKFKWAFKVRERPIIEDIENET